MDARHWFRDWAVQYDGFPDNYLVIDVETTGTCLERDLIIQLGWCRVIDRKVTDNNGTILNWARSPYVDSTWVKKRMHQTSLEMRKKCMNFPWEFSDLQSGKNPIHALAEFLERLTEIRASDDEIFIAHNGATFDMPMLSQHFERFLNIYFSFRPEEVWDTGALEKSSQLDELLCEGELPGDFAYRVLMRSGDGVPWNLHNHVIPKYDLANRFGLDFTKAHTAPFDAYVTHLLLEEYRQLAKQGLERHL